MPHFEHPALHINLVQEFILSELKTINNELFIKLEHSKMFCVTSNQFTGRYYNSIRTLRWRMWAFWAMLYIEVPSKLYCNVSLTPSEKLIILMLCQKAIPDNYGYDVVDVKVVVLSSVNYITSIKDRKNFDADALAVIDAASILINNPSNLVKSKAVALLADLAEAIRKDLLLLFRDIKKSDKFSEKLFSCFNNMNIRHNNLTETARLEGPELNFLFGVTLNILVYYYTIQASRELLAPNNL